MNINYYDGAGGQTTLITLDGDGANPASLAIAEAEPYDYSAQTVDSATLYTFNIVNSGNVPATGLAITSLTAPFSFPGGYPGTAIATACTTTLPALDNCDIVVEYLPTTTGLHLGNIDLNYNDGVTSQVEVQTLRGTGLSKALLTISEVDAYDFGTVANLSLIHI